MDEFELLLRHAERWAKEHQRTIDVSVVEEALRLRSVHDGLSANRWPARSVTHLMLVRWPSHGPIEPPDVPELVASLDTFWRFLRNTGRMAGGSADPKDLVREAKAAGRRMAAACADPANFGVSKQMFAFGQEIGITMDDLSSLDEANQRMQQIMDAWNALPTDERLRRSPSSGNAGSRMGHALTEAAGHMQQHGVMPPGWELPEPPRLDDAEDDGPVLPSDPTVSAPLYRSSAYLRRVLALCEWVGDGREVTGTDVLRPAVARQAYADLDLWDWEREWSLAIGRELPEESARDMVSQGGLSRWRTAADCLALDRLWLPALDSGLIAIVGKKAVFDGILPENEVEWAKLGQFLLLGLLHRAELEGVVDPLLFILLKLAWEERVPRSAAELGDLWWASAANSWPTDVSDQDLGRKLSDRDVRRCLAMFADCGAWTTRRGKLVGTEIGYDFALMVMVAIDQGVVGLR